MADLTISEIDLKKSTIFQSLSKERQLNFEKDKMIQFLTTNVNKANNIGFKEWEKSVKLNSTTKGLVKDLLTIKTRF